MGCRSTARSDGVYPDAVGSVADGEVMREREPNELELLEELRDAVGAAVDRHLAAAEEWFPHEFVPYDLGRDYREEPWSPGDSQISDIAQTALEVNLLTEDNLPYYHLSIWDAFREHDAWQEWIRRWTAEEGRHSIALRDFLCVTRGVDPQQLERGRMDMVLRGWYPRFAKLGPLDGVAYTSVQELATRISHRNTGVLTDDEDAVRLTARIATDENLHYVFYRDLAAAAFELAPSQMMLAAMRQVTDFQMPGVDMPGFAEKARAMARAGVYNLRIHHDQVLEPVLRTHWRITEVTGLSDEAELARDAIMAHLERLDRVARKLDEPGSPVVPQLDEAGSGIAPQVGGA
jgi:acyl-[acyl-carrier-protein] desaturase